jgi:simple sugar transport system substrate-binding protein
MVAAIGRKYMKKFFAVLAATAALALSAATADAAKLAVVGGSNDDAFWNLIKKGIDDARPGIEANGGSVEYLRLVNYDNFAPDVVGLIRTAISMKVDGLVIPNWVPESEDPAIKDAMAAGIKVILMNAGGGEKAKELGALNYVGSDEYAAGVAGGQQFAKLGAKKVLCVNHIPGAANLEARCKGIADGGKDGGVAVEQLPLPANLDGNVQAVAEAIKASLVQQADVDGVVTLAAWASDATALAVKQAGKEGKVHIGTFDMNQAVLDRIKSGEQKFAIDQQPYLQGLLATNLLAAHIDFGTVLPTFPVLTGPGIVDASNIDATLNGVAKGAR